ncbi:hypothetical protein HY249_00210, partial [Candidatus Azambacteria bacterium]|nr:hypothetical protein [Candidatus Azambacteria bacterium]
MNIERLKEILVREGQSNFRLKQAKKAVFSRLISSWDEASDLPEKIRK